MRKICELSAPAVILGTALLGGCAPSHLKTVPDGAVAYQVIPPANTAQPRTSYKLVPGDVLNVQVFQEPDLSNSKLTVDDMGNIQIPLIGEVEAAGRSASDVSDEIAMRLKKKYIVDPIVVVSIAESAARFVSVDGQVAKPGVYEIDTDYTLLTAIARAEGALRTAKMNEIVIIRDVDGQRMAGRFDLDQIRSGLAPDPAIKGGDVIIVGKSRVAALWEDFLKAAPFNAFVLAFTR